MDYINSRDFCCAHALTILFDAPSEKYDILSNVTTGCALCTLHSALWLCFKTCFCSYIIDCIYNRDFCCALKCSFKCYHRNHAFSNLMTLKKHKKIEWIISTAESFAVLALWRFFWRSVWHKSAYKAWWGEYMHNTFILIEN